MAETWTPGTTRTHLLTEIEERAMRVATYLGNAPRARPGRPQPFTAVWAGPRHRLVWLRFYDGPTTSGGLAEAHAWVVQQVAEGRLPDACTEVPYGQATETG